MGKLTLHAKIEVCLGLALLLGSCGADPYGYRPGFSDEKIAEIQDIAGDMSVDPDEFANLQSRVSEIESRLGM